VELAETRALVRLANRRFQSFSDATGSVLAALEEIVPGAVLLAELQAEELSCRVIDLSGAGPGAIDRGSTLPLDGSRDISLDDSFLREIGVGSCLATPLELSDGRVVGILSGLHDLAGAYDSNHAAFLGIAARLLSQEWESVERRAELRRLRDRLRDGTSTDAATGLADRDRFLDRAGHEFSLVGRGALRAVVVAWRIEVSSPDGAGEAQVGLAVKDVAEVLRGTARATDHLGRIGEDGLGAILVGTDEDGARVFAARVDAALLRMTRGRPFRVDATHGIADLAGASSAEQALQTAEQEAAREPERVG
jgi:GGDEF domain-containing protein